MTNIHLREWERVKDQIIAFEQLEHGWDGADADPIPPRMVRVAIIWADQLKSQDFAPPNDVYPLSDGNVILEWHLPDDEIRRIEVKEDFAEEMLSYPSSASKFKTLPLHPSNYIGGYLAQIGQFVPSGECFDELDCPLAA